MKKKILKLFILFIVLTGIDIPAFTQVSLETEYYEMLVRYWHYRNRLRYFVVNNENSNPDELGIANVSDIRNRMANWANGGNIHNIQFDQQLSSMGYYIGVLATEYYLLSYIGMTEDAQNTLNELYRALLSLKRLDLCESRWPYYEPPDEWDGYLIRTDVPVTFALTHADELNDGLDQSLTNVEQSIGIPLYVNKVIHAGLFPNGSLDEQGFYKQNEMSRDEISKLFVGLALVKRCITPVLQKEWDVYNLNKDIAKKIYLKIANSEFKIYNPKGMLINNNNDEGGALMWDLCYGFYNATKYICDNDASVIIILLVYYY